MIKNNGVCTTDMWICLDETGPSEPSIFHINGSTQEPFSDESLILPWLVEHAGCILSRSQKGP